MILFEADFNVCNTNSMIGLHACSGGGDGGGGSVAVVRFQLMIIAIECFDLFLPNPRFIINCLPTNSTKQLQQSLISRKKGPHSHT